MAVNYTYNDLSVKDAIFMTLGGVRYEVVQFSTAFAANEIPVASVMLAIGRDARNSKRYAKVHRYAKTLKQMEKAKVWQKIRGTFDRNVEWPVGQVTIFDGFFTGFAYRKVNGKVCVIANLVHWSVALAFSSAITSTGHVSNPTALNVAAVYQHLGSTGAGQGNYIGKLAPEQLAFGKVGSDVWAAIKSIFCAVASLPALPVGTVGGCGGAGNARINSAAIEALSKIEGSSDGMCDMPYKYGVPLQIDTAGITEVLEAIAAAIGNEFVESYANVSFWDKLVGQFCPMFGMAFLPMADSALVVADCPAYSRGFWRELSPDDYDSFDLTKELHRPLRGIGVLANFNSQTQAGMNEYGNNLDIIGGCFVEDSIAPGDGMMQYVATPPWLRLLHSQSNYAPSTSGVRTEEAVKSSTTPNAPPSVSPTPTPDTIGARVDRLYQRYAHEVFVANMLRGQNGVVSGKLRFDIAPLSILKLRASTDRFIGAGQDNMAFDVYACVQRVTISINADAGMAGTTFNLSHMRTEAENNQERTSTTRHPLFGTSIHGGGKHGSPLIGEYELPLAGDGPAIPPTVT